MYNVYYYKDSYYVDIDEVNEEDICLLSDFYEVIYGDVLEEIKGKLKLVVKTCWYLLFLMYCYII